jgi:hypothetical protein
MDIVSFYAGMAPDHRGRFLEDIRNFDYEQLETVHDYIQWLFPLNTRSRFNPSGPCLTEEQIKLFRESRELQRELARSFESQLGFLGFQFLADPEPHLKRAANFPSRKTVWLKSGNHNCLRISRMLRSMSLLGLAPNSKALLKALEQLPWYDRWRLGPDTYRRWRSQL